MQLRAKITPRLEPGAVVVLIEWITVDEGSNIVRGDDGQPIIAHREEVRLMQSRDGCGYVSEVGFPEANVTAPFFVDENWKRHFVVKAEAGDMAQLGGDVGMKRTLAAAG